MRLWHKDLLEVLPNSQLLGQNRECCAMEADLLAKGKVNHVLINFLNKTNLSHLYSYHLLVMEEMKKRNYNITYKTLERLEYFKNTFSCYEIKKEDVFNYIHTERYLLQCYYNLQEKFDNNGLTLDEWKIIEEKIKDVTKK